MTEQLTAGGILRAVAAGLIGLDGPYEYTGEFFSDFFPAALLALGIAGLVAFSVLLFRAVARRDAPSEDDREHARRLVRLYGSDTLDYFALRPDKSYFFSSDGESMVAYTYESGYALVAADPIGRPGSEELVLDEFLDLLPRPRLAGGVPGGARVRHVALPRARLPRGLPRRRGDHPLRPLHAPGEREEVGAVGRQAGRARPPLPADARVRRLAAARRGAEQDPRALARQGARARLHDGAGRRRARRRARTSCWRSRSRARASGPTASCGSCPATATTRAGRST